MRSWEWGPATQICRPEGVVGLALEVGSVSALGGEGCSGRILPLWPFSLFPPAGKEVRCTTTLLSLPTLPVAQRGR